MSKTFTFFLGHTQKEEGKRDKSCLSQWFPATFKVDGIEYNSTEQYMMAHKAGLFEDYDICDQIMSEKSVKRIKALGRKVKNFDEKKWAKKSIAIVKKANYAKFSQNRDMQEFLMSCRGIIVEASPYDKIWGNGLLQDHPDSTNPELWPGENKLGSILTELRDEFIAEDIAIDDLFER